MRRSRDYTSVIPIVMAVTFPILSTARTDHAASSLRPRKTSDRMSQRWACGSIPVQCFPRSIGTKFLSLNTAHGIAARPLAIASLWLSSRAIKLRPTDRSLRAGCRGVEHGAGPSMCSSCPMERCWSLTTKPERFIGSATKNKTGRSYPENSLKQKPSCRAYLESDLGPRLTTAYFPDQF